MLDVVFRVEAGLFIEPKDSVDGVTINSVWLIDVFVPPLVYDSRSA
jgi:hypothetical protein